MFAKLLLKVTNIIKRDKGSPSIIAPPIAPPIAEQIIIRSQCKTCSGYGLIKTDSIICDICNGSKCMNCNSIGLTRLPWSECPTCYGSGEIMT